MWKSSNGVAGSQGFSIEVTKDPADGRYVATSTSQIAIPAMRAETEAEAVEMVKQAIQVALLSGEAQ